MASILEESGFNPERELKIVGSSPIKPDGPDKVTGRAKFGADMKAPGMLVGKILRSPHPHALVKSIDTSKAEALPGVMAVVTGDDFRDHAVGSGLWDLTRNVMAREKVLYDGHALAAVAATSESIARQALKLIEVDYEKLPHVIDAVEAMQPGAPILHEHLRTKGVPNAEDKATNVVERLEFGKGDVQAGFRLAHVVIERVFKTRPIHQGYIEPPACLANYTSSGRVELWCSTQAAYGVRDSIAGLLGMAKEDVRVTPSEIGGGFGGKTTVYLEPVAIVLSRKSGRPVRIVMSRDEVFRATGPVTGTHARIKIGVTRDGKFTAAEAELILQTGAFTGSMFINAPQAIFTRYDLENVKAVAYEVVSNRTKVNAFRAPCVPPVVFGVESLIDELAEAIEMDPIDLRLKNAATEGYVTVYGETLGPIGFVETLEAAKRTEHYNAPLGPNQGRGVGAGFWFNRGGDTSGRLEIAADGNVHLTLGTVDIAGSRSSITMMAAEELGIALERVSATIGNTDQLSYNRVTAGSRVTFSSGMIVVDAARKAIAELRSRAARIWDVEPDQVVYEDGYCRIAQTATRKFELLSMADLVKQTGPICCESAMVVTGAGPGFGLHIVDVEVDRETGATRVLRYTVVEDAGKAINRRQVEGQYQGGAAQGIGWALNEEYIYGEDGRLQNPSFLDYRMPVASDLPMIDAVIVEVPNPRHPYGLRGVGEVPVVPTLGAIANAVTHAIGVRPYELPMSPPRLLKLMSSAQPGGRSTDAPRIRAPGELVPA